MSGIRTVVWKELREVFYGGGRPLVGIIVGAAFALLVGIAVPLLTSFGFTASHKLAYALTVSASLTGVSLFMCMLSPLATVVDTFAGERERHTLETLLALPLSDRAIVTGKLLAQYITGWCTVVIVATSGAATATAIVGVPGLLVFPLVLVGGLVGGTLGASLMVGAGSLISLSAPTVKKGQERLGYLMMPVFLLMSVFPGFVLPRLTGGDADSLVLAGIVAAIAGPLVFLGLTALFMTLVYARFRRDRLIGR